ncbi:hypothetical protein [Nocardia asteroides]|uniref:hypothetical protein n=1 Tax=Nocardia asteroides TaxID=1824 RepID=UPI0033EBC58C
MGSQDIIAQLRQDITTAGDAGDEATVARLRGELATALRETGAGSAATVTEDDLRALLDVTAADARLVLSEGKVGVHSGTDYAGGGLLVITRADLLDRVGSPADDRKLTETAALLDTDIRLLGA